jgi:hypothetical protein
MSENDIGTQSVAEQITPELLSKIGINPELFGILMGISLAVVPPQTGLIRRLVVRDMISRDEAIGVYEELLMSSQFPPAINELVRPIWTKMIEAIRKEEI